VDSICFHLRLNRCDATTTTTQNERRAVLAQFEIDIERVLLVVPQDSNWLYDR
jgi:hypothetical protein